MNIDSSSNDFLFEIERKNNAPFAAILRIGLSTLPYVGSPLVQAWSEYENSQQASYISSAFSYISQRLSVMNTRIITSCLTPENWQLFEEVFRRVKIEHNEEKRKQFAEMLLSSWTHRLSDPFEKKMMFVRALEEFTPLHLLVLKLLKDSSNDYLSVDQIKEHTNCVKTRGYLLPVLFDLATRYGFIVRKNDNNGILLQINPEGLSLMCTQRITELGKDFLAYIEGNGFEGVQ